MDAKTEQRIIDLYIKYNCARLVCEKVPVCEETVYRVLRRHGIPRTAPKKEKDDRPKCQKRSFCYALVLMLYSFGYKTKDIADAAGTSCSAVVNASYRHGVNVSRITKSKRQERDKRIVDLRKQGISTYEIGERIGISHATVSKVLIDNGLGVGYGGGNTKKSNAARHDAAIAKYGSEVAWKRHKNEKPWKHTSERWQYWCSKTGAEYDKTVTLPALLRRDGYTCSSCGIECTKDDRKYGHIGPTYPTMDHIVPLSKGGSHTWDNVQVMCFSCNIAKKDKVVSA